MKYKENESSLKYHNELAKKLEIGLPKEHRMLTTFKWKTFFQLLQELLSPEITLWKKSLVFKSEKQVTTEVSLEMHLWLQLVPPASLLSSLLWSKIPGQTTVPFWYITRTLWLWCLRGHTVQSGRQKYNSHQAFVSISKPNYISTTTIISIFTDLELQSTDSCIQRDSSIRTSIKIMVTECRVPLLYSPSPVTNSIKP